MLYAAKGSPCRALPNERKPEHRTAISSCFCSGHAPTMRDRQLVTEHLDSGHATRLKLEGSNVSDSFRPGVSNEPAKSSKRRSSSGMAPGNTLFVEG